MMLTALLALAALVIAIVVAAQLSAFRTRIEKLEKLVERPAGAETTAVAAAPKSAVPPPLPQFVSTRPAAASPAPVVAPVSDATAGINWESFVGVRLFAWIGGLAFFLGVVFFVKYAFENNLISPRIRILGGGFIGLTIIAAGMLPSLRRYRIPAQSLIATGVLICYADTYAAFSFYNLISLTAASVLMWLVTAIGLAVGARTDAPGILWLAVIGGFLTPLLFRTTYQSAVGLFGYVGVLSCGIAAVSAVKRWPYFILAAAICAVLLEFTWAAGFFHVVDPEAARLVFFIFQGLFLVIAIALARTNRADVWSLAAGAVAGFASLIAFVEDPLSSLPAWDYGFLTLVVGSAGLIMLAASHRGSDSDAQSKTAATILLTALILAGLAEWSWWYHIINKDPGSNHPTLTMNSSMATVGAWHIAVFLLFSATPYLCGDERTWPWIIAAIAGPVQFWFVYYYLGVASGFGRHTPVVPHHWKWLLPVGFALPAAGGLYYLMKRRGIALSSGDTRLASQGAAVLAFVSLIFPVQFHREWITLGWAVEGLGLILLFQWLPNRRLRAVGLMVLFAAFVRLALNPAVLDYHRRSDTPILNWYLYAYGVAAVCLFAGARWFGPPREREYERYGPGILYTLSGIIVFLLLNIEIADYFSIGPTLTFSFAGNFARDMTYTISWSLFAFLGLVLGMLKQIRRLRFAAVVLLCAALAKLFLHDLDNLSQLYRIAAFISVAIVAIVASFAYQRFLSPSPKQ